MITGSPGPAVFTQFGHVGVGSGVATVLFTDIVGSTERAAALGDRRWRDVLERHDRLLKREVGRYRGRVVKSTGDGALATFDGPARAVRAGMALRSAAPDTLGSKLRVGVHTGECELIGDDLGGIGVHIAARHAPHTNAKAMSASPSTASSPKKKRSSTSARAARTAHCYGSKTKTPRGFDRTRSVPWTTSGAHPG